jgi:hypothetical protein
VPSDPHVVKEAEGLGRGNKHRTPHIDTGSICEGYRFEFVWTQTVRSRTTADAQRSLPLRPSRLRGGPHRAALRMTDDRVGSKRGIAFAESPRLVREPERVRAPFRVAMLGACIADHANDRRSTR